MLPPPDFKPDSVDRNDLRCTAFHEAGHAVADAVLNIEFEKVWIVPDVEGKPTWELSTKKRTRNRCRRTPCCLSGNVSDSLGGWIAAGPNAEVARSTIARAQHPGSEDVRWVSRKAARFGRTGVKKKIEPSLRSDEEKRVKAKRVKGYRANPGRTEHTTRNPMRSHR